MRKDSARLWMLVLASVAAGMGCSEEEEGGCARQVVTSAESCRISSDCASAGLDLSCVNGVCRLPCRTDAECDLVANVSPTDDPECAASAATTPAAVCEAGLCEVGCPDEPCGERETCFEGRCVVYAEGFEIPEGDRGVDLVSLGFNDPPKELPNNLTKILFAGLEGCTPQVDSNCAGPAGQGVRFVILETQPTPPKGQAVTDLTCRACACCLECLAEPPPNPISLNSCPRTPDIPTPISCPIRHPSCDALCAECELCPPADRPGVLNNPLLLACEETAASRRCERCDACDAFLETCRQDECPVCAGAPASEACRDCVDENCVEDPRCQDCLVCADAQRCARNDPGSAQCNQLNSACIGQGASGCFNVPTDYLRAQLRDDEQALTSPVIDLSAVDGNVVMQFDYLAFDVGVTYFPGVQGQPPDQWPEVPQNVRVQFCAGACDQEAEWTDAMLVSGGIAALPFDGQRNNGRLLGDQTVIDWRVGRVTMVVPPGFRTATFRYRLLPALADGALMAVDNILIRRAQ